MNKFPIKTLIWKNIEFVLNRLCLITLYCTKWKLTACKLHASYLTSARNIIALSLDVRRCQNECQKQTKRENKKSTVDEFPVLNQIVWTSWITELQIWLINRGSIRYLIPVSTCINHLLILFSDFIVGPKPKKQNWTKKKRFSTESKGLIKNALIIT